MSSQRGPSIPIVRRHFEFKETAVTILAEERFIPLAERTILLAREGIERFIIFDPMFKDTLEPYSEPADAPAIVKRMCEAGRAASVGPMAAVAGAISETAVQAMVEEGARHAVVDNGGDIALFLSEPIDVGIYTLNPRFAGLGFRVDRLNELFGICTSSGVIGPSISFGKAEAAVVIAKNVALADACATLLGNMTTSDDDRVLQMGLDAVVSVEGVEGAMVIIGEKLAIKGAVPRLVKVNVPWRSISKREYG